MNWINKIVRWYKVTTCNHTWVAKYNINPYYGLDKYQYICTKCAAQRDAKGRIIK